VNHSVWVDPEVPTNSLQTFMIFAPLLGPMTSVED